MPDRQIDYRDPKPANTIHPKTPRERRRLGLIADEAAVAVAAVMPIVIPTVAAMLLLALGAFLAGCSPADPAPALGRACECEAYPCAPDDCAGATCYGGTCSQRCEVDADCPTGAVCDVGAPGGCRWSCSSADDCPDLDVATCERAMCFAGPVVAR